MSIEGTFECVLKTPLGAKSGSLVVIPSSDGEHFTGSLSNGLLGTVEIVDGTIDGDMLLCQVSVTKPMRMQVDCEVIVDGDKLSGFITAGRFGEMKLSGHRKA